MIQKGHILQLFPDLFEGVGTMEDVQVHLDVDPAIEPVVQAPHKIPHGMLDPLKSELHRMLKLYPCWTLRNCLINCSLAMY